MLLFFSCSQNDKVQKHTYSFFDTSNYYIKNNKIGGFALDSQSYFSPLFFSIIDEQGFLNSQDYDRYVLFWNGNSFSDFDLILSIKTLKGTSTSIATVSLINYNAGKVIPAVYRGPLSIRLQKCDYRIRKKSWKIDKENIDLLIDSIENVIDKRPSQPRQNISDGATVALYYDGKKYHFISTPYFYPLVVDNLYKHVLNELMNKRDSAFNFVKEFKKINGQ